jgi:hypothetical protein
MPADPPIRGSCLCGAVAFELAAPPLWMSHCHCSRCRKAGGITTVVVRAEHFRWLRGREQMTRYQAPGWSIVRCFCGTCGAYLGEPETHPEAFAIAASALDDDPRVRAAFHEHVADRAPWDEIHDALPQFAASPGADASSS